MPDNTNYTLLNIDKSSKSNLLIDTIAYELHITNIHTADFMDSLEILIDTSVNVIILHTVNCSDQQNIFKFLEMLSSDIENKNTPIIIISDFSDNENFSEILADYNIISIFMYANWKYQVKSLLHTLSLSTRKSKTLVSGLSKSEERTIKDPLAGTLNRYGAEDCFINFSSRYIAYEENFSLIMLDIDHFKAVNDTHGHDVGDEVIISLADIIQNTIRKTDKLIRFGGEEFLVFIANANLDVSTKIAEKLRVIIQNTLHSSKKLEITASFGVVEYKTRDSIESMTKKADLLLYKAKDSGRNIVMHTLGKEANNIPDSEPIVNNRERNNQIIYSNLILNQYYQATNISSIVSKTDIHGIITFVNDKFVTLSGYSEKELLGSPHNIVRHPDMNSEIFKKLWETISSKNMWDGIISNKSKDGSTYVVHAYVFPIVNNQDDIIEYISIRHILKN